MSEGEERTLTAEKLAFFGAISASMTHELKNVLATINEFAGLLDDLSHAAAAGRPLTPERLQTICGKIAAQVGRGEQLLTGLNRFAHSVDEPVATVEISALVRNIASLCQRFANLKQVTLETHLPESAETIRIDPFACRHAVYLCIDMALRAAAEQRKVTVSLDLGAGEARIVVESADPFERGGAPDRAEVLDAILSRSGARSEWIAQPGRDRVALSFPAG